MSECYACDHGVPTKVSTQMAAVFQEQIRFPRSKKKRIRKKWAKDPRNFRPAMQLIQFTQPNAAAMREFLERVKNAPVVSIDIETRGLDGFQEAN